MTIDGSRAVAGTIVASSSRRTGSGSSTTGAPPACSTSKKYADSPCAAPGGGVGAEVAHRVLEAARRALVVDAERLAVEHEVTAGQPGDERGDARRGDR